MSESFTTEVTSGFAYHARQPFVTLTMTHQVEGRPDTTLHMQMNPEKAREIAGMLVECAEASEVDGFLVTFFQRKVGISEEHAVGLLREFRAWRDRRQGGPDDGAPGGNDAAT